MLRIISRNNDYDIIIPDTNEIGKNSFNALRFFCCIIVILGHCMDISHSSFPCRVFFDMHISVCVFFILSGFWVTKSLLSAKNLKDYAIRRIKRLLPLYYLSVFFFALICGFFSSYSLRQYYFSIGFYKYLFWNSIFLNFIYPSLPGVFDGNAINGALWTIKVEIGFYLILPILIYYLRRLNSNKKRNIFLVVTYILSVTWNVGIIFLARYVAIPKQLSHQLPGFLSCFVMGMFFLINWSKIISKKNYFIAPAVVVFCFHYITKTEFLMPIALTCIIMWAGKTFIQFNRIGYPVDYSYGIYLFHFPLINIFTKYSFFSYSFTGSVISIISISFFMAFIADKYIQSIIR